MLGKVYYIILFYINDTIKYDCDTIKYVASRSPHSVGSEKFIEYLHIRLGPKYF